MWLCGLPLCYVPPRLLPTLQVCVIITVTTSVQGSSSSQTATATLVNPTTSTAAAAAAAAAAHHPQHCSHHKYYLQLSALDHCSSTSTIHNRRKPQSTKLSKQKAGMRNTRRRTTTRRTNRTTWIEITRLTITWVDITPQKSTCILYEVSHWATISCLVSHAVVQGQR